MGKPRDICVCLDILIGPHLKSCAQGFRDVYPNTASGVLTDPSAVTLLSL